MVSDTLLVGQDRVRLKASRRASSRWSGARSLMAEAEDERESESEEETETGGEV